MPSRRQIRETAVQFLYCADLEGGADPADLRGPFWDFVTESDRRSLQVATFRTVRHLAEGREGRLEEFVSRSEAAVRLLAGYPEAEPLKRALERVGEGESKWSTALAALERLPTNDDDDESVARRFGRALDDLFRIDRDLAAARDEFLRETEDHPKLKGPMEAVAATMRRLQRVSDRLRMVEEPENFPEQTDLAKIRKSKKDLTELRLRSDELVDAVLATKDEIDAKLAATVENFKPGRIDPVDRAILRLATHEILHTELPVKVAINEAVDLAKRFGTTESGRFVNGVLDKVARSSRGSEDGADL